MTRRKRERAESKDCCRWPFRQLTFALEAATKDLELVHSQLPAARVIWHAHMFVCEAGGQAAAGCFVYEAFLDEKGLIDVLQSIFFL